MGGVFDLSGSHNPPSFYSTGFPHLCLTFSCGSLHQFPSVVGWSLSNENWTREQSTSAADYNYKSFHSFYVFGSILCLWAVHHIGPVPTDNVRPGFLLIMWVSSWTSHWLTTPIISLQPTSQNILQAIKCYKYIIKMRNKTALFLALYNYSNVGTFI